MRNVAVLLAVILVTTLYMQRGNSVPQEISNPVILAFGDSLTFGFGTRNPARESYPARLESLTGQPVVNAGVNGETSAEGLRRIDALLKRHTPGLTLLCLGGNDILQNVPKEQLRDHLKALIEKIRDSGSAVLLIAVPDFGLLGLSDLTLYEELSDEMHIPLLGDLLGPILSNPSLKSDTIHPNAAGYRIMAEKIYEKLKQEELLYENGTQH
jgi:lysophospholipase L1-like esterase